MDPPGQPLHRRLSRYFWGFPPFLASPYSPGRRQRRGRSTPRRRRSTAAVRSLLRHADGPARQGSRRRARDCSRVFARSSWAAAGPAAPSPSCAGRRNRAPAPRSTIRRSHTQARDTSTRPPVTCERQRTAGWIACPRTPVVAGAPRVGRDLAPDRARSRGGALAERPRLAPAAARNRVGQVGQSRKLSFVFNGPLLAG